MTPREECWLALKVAHRVGARTVSTLLEAFGDVEAVFAADAGEIVRRTGLSPDMATRIETARDAQAFRMEKRAVEDAGARLIPRDAPDYPPLLEGVPLAPPLLYCLGTWPLAAGPRMAIVGTRRPSRYGEKMTREIVAAFAAAWPGGVVVSGLARGIDTVAHTHALDCGIQTIGVLGGGLGRIYPAENAPLAERMRGQGALLSEFYMNQRPAGQNFPIRNRVISGLSHLTVVVEAGLRSGALITAGFASNHGRPVLALPGDIDREESQGANRLIRTGQATLLGSPADVVEAIQDVLHPRPDQLDLLAPREEAGATGAMGSGGGQLAPRRAPASPMEGEKGQLMECLQRGPLHPDDLSDAVGLPIEKVIGLLLELELSGDIVQTTQNQYRIA